MSFIAKSRPFCAVQMQADSRQHEHGQKTLRNTIARLFLIYRKISHCMVRLSKPSPIFQIFSKNKLKQVLGILRALKPALMFGIFFSYYLM